MRISQFNSTKLLIAVIGLLIGAFVMLSMALPEEQPNDTTATSSGRRRSHYYNEGTCSTTEHGNVDYAKAIAITTGGGSVTISSPSGGGAVTNEGGTSGFNNGDQVRVEWNCNSTADMNETKTDADAHKRVVQFEATADANHNFAGWSTTANENNIESRDNPFKTEMFINDWNKNNGSHESADDDKALTITYYAIFKEKVQATITFAPTDGGSYTYSCPEGSGTISVTEQSVTTGNELVLAANPASEYKFFGWYILNGEEKEYFSYSQNISKAFETDVTIGAKFIPADMAIFKVGNENFFDLNVANYAATASSTDKTIILAKDGKLYAGDYTISSGVTLLIPDDREVVEREEPTSENPAQGNPKPFRTLTMDIGAKILVNGYISVASKLYATGTVRGQSGVRAYYGYIFMKSGSEIVLNNGAVLYAWGYISGDGEITAKSGAKVYEMFQFTDFRGGTCTSSMILEKSKKVFPFSQYYVQNIEAKLNIEYGATEYVRTIIYASEEKCPSEITLIGTSGALFTMKNGVISKQYLPVTDRMYYSVNSNIQLNAISLELKLKIITTISYPLKSNDYVLPISNNMTIDMKTGSSFELSQDAAFLPGAEFNIEKGATFSIPQGKNLYVYDMAEWQDFVYGNSGGLADVNPLSYVARNGSGKAGTPTSRTLSDARIKIDGEVNVTGGFYTTTSGADIYSTEGGVILYKANAGTSNSTYQVTQSGTSPTYVKVSITSSQLHNALTGDVEYTSTENTPANTTINYRNGHWGWLTKWLDYDGATILHQVVAIGSKEESEYAYSGTPPSGMVFDSWKVKKDDANQEITYIAQLKSTIGDVLDIVDWTATSVTLNLNGIPAAGWPYTINGKSYTKDQRAADRTLTIPYSGKADEGLVITLTKQGGEVYSRHTCTIPHVFTTSADLTDVQATSVVFVKDGAKLSVPKSVSVSKIVVAPGAELAVDNGATLTTEELLLRTTPWQAAILDNQGTINTTHTYYTRIVASNSQYYQFALPLASDVKDVTLSSKSKCTYGTSWLLKSYDEASRAKNGEANTEALSNWKQLEADASGSAAIAASVGYEMFSNTPYYREFYFPVVLPASKATEVPVSHTDGAAGAAHAGWNALCSPLTGKFTQTFSTPSEGIKVSELTEDGNYLQCMPTVIYPAVPFYYQAPKFGTLDFSGSELKLIQKAPQRAWNTSASEQWLRLMLNDATGRMLDETNIFTHPEKFSVDYESGYDVIKQSTTGGKALLYSELVCGALAFAALPDSAAESRILLTVYVAEAKPYTFHLEDNAYLNRLNNVFLHDTETGAVIDLLTNDYAVTLSEGTTRGRFYITCVFKAPNITTDVETTIQDKQIAPIQKVFYNGKVYILRNGIVYDLTGRQCEMK